MRKITGEEIGFFDEHGYVVCRDVLREDELASFRAETSRLIDEIMSGGPASKLCVWSVDVPFNLPNLHAYGNDFSLRLLGHPFIGDALARMIGRDFFPTYDSLLFKLPFQGNSVRWHCDVATPAPPCSERTVVFGVYADRATVENGCVWVIPGSHLWEDERLRETLERAKAEFALPAAVPVEVEAGGVLIHHGRLLHSSTPNATGELRRTVYLDFKSVNWNEKHRYFERKDVEECCRLYQYALHRRKTDSYLSDDETFDYLPPEGLPVWSPGDAITLGHVPAAGRVNARQERGAKRTEAESMSDNAQQDLNSIRRSRPRNDWVPILDGPPGERALGAVRDIAQSLCDREPGGILEGAAHPSDRQTVGRASLAGGQAGLAVHYAYLAQAWPDGVWDESASSYLQQAVNAVSAVPMTTSLYGGFTGVSWAVEHLRGRLFDPDDDEDPNEAIDEALKVYLNRSPWRDDYDLISGLVGLGVYALERLPRAAAVECLKRVVDRLDETAERSAEGITWFTPPELLVEWQREKYTHGYYNLGLAHGAPGVIAFLGQVCAVDVALEKARPLLDGAVAWLLRQRLPDEADSSFSYSTGPDIEQDGSRLAWCYGDPGVAAALLSAARCVGETVWEQEALAIARRAAGRRLKQSGVVDAGLCHGAAGVGHIFNRLFQATGEAGFKEAARYWFARTLEMRHPERGIAGFSAWNRGDGGETLWVDQPGILTGAAGIALALLAAVTDIEPAWDRMLLLSIPPPRTT